MREFASTLGIVAIGRNEGQRLVDCLTSLAGLSEHLVYVDSGSKDGSVLRAKELGAVVIELDPAEPFTAARARNEGVRYLASLENPPTLVQLLDGDCRLEPAWLPQATEFLANNPKVGIVCGRRRERFPEASVFNSLCDMEWNTKVGPGTSCGGDALVRMDAFQAAGGYNQTMIAGEDPEFAYRVERTGWGLYRLDADMTWHDANITRLRQWWLRTKRAGHAYAECYFMHRSDGTEFRRRELRSILFWGFGLPVALTAAAILTGGWSLPLFAAYPVLWWRIRRYRLGCGDQRSEASTYAWFCLLGKFAEATGALRFGLGRLTGSSERIIEYKGDPGGEPGAA
jgi:GT2 family glycosyltransferase